MNEPEMNVCQRLESTSSKYCSTYFLHQAGLLRTSTISDRALCRRYLFPSGPSFLPPLPFWVSSITRKGEGGRKAEEKKRLCDYQASQRSRDQRDLLLLRPFFFQKRRLPFSFFRESGRRGVDWRGRRGEGTNLRGTQKRGRGQRERQEGEAWVGRPSQRADKEEEWNLRSKDRE